MIVLFGMVAHNIIVWARRWLVAPNRSQFGILRMVRDVFHLSGFLACDASGSLTHIALNQAVPLTSALPEPPQQATGLDPRCCYFGQNVGVEKSSPDSRPYKEINHIFTCSTLITISAYTRIVTLIMVEGINLTGYV